MELKNTVALVAGGARIGMSVAETLAERGCDVAVTYRSSRAAALETKQRVESHGRRAVVIRADLTRDKDVRRAVDEIKRRFGRLDVLVNMTSVYERTPFADLDERVWRRMIDANLTAGYLLVLRAAPLLRQHGGRVVHFSDWVAASGRPRYPGFVPYFVAKSGVIGLTQAQALELAPSILVNAIAPGPILPPPGITKKEVREVKRATPIGHWGGAGEIVKAVVFLIDTDFVTGECVRVDGGRHLL